MVRFATIKSSELGDRWDAAFHIALSQLGDRITELRTTLTEEEAVNKLSGIPTRDKAFLSILVRGQANSLGATRIADAVREYPYLALALMEHNLEPAIERIRAEIARHEDALKQLIAIAADSPSSTVKP